MTEAAVDTTTATEDVAIETTTTEAPSAWYGEVDADKLTYMQSKGWHEDGGGMKAIDSYRQLESVFKKSGQDPERVIMMPKDMENEQEVREFYNKLGVPESTDGYEVEIDEGDTLLPKFLETSIKNGAPKSLVQKQVEDYREWVSEVQREREEAFERQAQEGSQQFTKEQGAALEQSKALANQARMKFPFFDEHAEAMERAVGTKAYLDFALAVGKAIGEDVSLGITDGGVQNVSSAQQELAQMKGDVDTMNAYTDRSHPQHQATKVKMDKLYSMAFPNNT